MEKSKKNKRNKNKSPDKPSTTDISSLKQKLKSTFNLDTDNISSEFFDKLTSYLNLLNKKDKLQTESNSSDLSDLAVSTLKSYHTLHLDELMTNEINSKLTSQNNTLKTKNTELNKKITDKDKFSKILIDKIKSINEEKQKLIEEEVNKRNEIVKATEDFVHQIQVKYEEDLPAKQKLIEENQNLRKEIELCVKSTLEKKELIENQLRAKCMLGDEWKRKVEDKLKEKMERLTNLSEGGLVEKTNIIMELGSIRNNNLEMENIVGKYNDELAKLVNEIEKVIGFLLILEKTRYCYFS